MKQVANSIKFLNIASLVVSWTRNIYPTIGHDTYTWAGDFEFSTLDECVSKSIKISNMVEGNATPWFSFAIRSQWMNAKAASILSINPQIIGKRLETEQTKPRRMVCSMPYVFT